MVIKYFVDADHKNVISRAHKNILTMKTQLQSFYLLHITLSMSIYLLFSFNILRYNHYYIIANLKTAH